MYSCEQVDMGITLASADGLGFITGKNYNDEEQFVDYIKSRVVHYHDMIKS